MSNAKPKPKPRNLINKYCAYCRRQTLHEINACPDGGPQYNKEGTGGNLSCTECGSSRLDTIQGFDAALM